MTLRTKISLIFIFIAAVSSLAVAVITLSNTNKLFNTYVDERIEAKEKQWEQILVSYYIENGGWEGVETLFFRPRANKGGMGMHHRRMHHNHSQTEDVMFLTDTKYKVIASNDDSTPRGAIITSGIKKSGKELYVNDNLVGYLFINPESKGISNLEEDFLKAIIKSVFTAYIFVALLSILAGLIFGKRLASPLQKLTTAILKIKSGDWQSRVQLQDKTEIGILAEAFNEMAENLEKMEKARRNLTADVAHELRNPLAIMRGQLETVLEGDKKPSKELIFSLNDEVLRMSRIVDDLQSLSLAEAGQLKLNKEYFFLSDIFETYREFLLPQLEEKNIKLIIEETNSIPKVYADKNRIQQVILNLLTNALRHVSDNGIIRVKIFQEGDFVTTEVYNSGSSLKEEEIPFIFERFYKGDKTKYKKGSTGLGLAIAKGYIEAHKGKVTAKNSPGGVSFIFTLPLF